MTLVSRAFQRINRVYAVRRNVKVGANVHIGPGTRLWAPTSLQLGANVYIGKRCTLEVDGLIGFGTLIANHVGIVGRWDHDHKQVGVPVRCATWCGDDRGAHLRTAVDIGHDVWIGFGAIILAPVRIGHGAIVSAGAVVRDDVAPYAIVAGNPARSVGTRFTPDDQRTHERVMRKHAANWRS